jgi:ABC-type glycerol-3-phosphate transport system permease component
VGSYWAFWKRGWWAWLCSLCTNIAFAVLIIPLAFVFHDDQRTYLLAAIAVWFAIGAPLSGWLFEYFAAGSARLITKETYLEIAGEQPQEPGA